MRSQNGDARDRVFLEGGLDMDPDVADDAVNDALLFRIRLVGEVGDDAIDAAPVRVGFDEKVDVVSAKCSLHGERLERLAPVAVRANVGFPRQGRIVPGDMGEPGVGIRQVEVCGDRDGGDEKYACRNPYETPVAARWDR